MISHVDVNDIVQFYGTGKRGIVARVVSERKGDWLSVFVQDDMVHVSCLPTDVKRIGTYNPSIPVKDGDYCTIII